MAEKKSVFCCPGCWVWAGAAKKLFDGVGGALKKDPELPGPWF